MPIQYDIISRLAYAGDNLGLVNTIVAIRLIIAAAMWIYRE
jgi:hypothetical protein